jgi:hypothetical protein
MKVVSFFVFSRNGAPVEWNWQEKAEVLGKKTCPSATLSTTNPTWTNPGSNQALRDGRPTINRLSHGTALSKSLMVFNCYPNADINKIMRTIKVMQAE